MKTMIPGQRPEQPTGMRPPRESEAALSPSDGSYAATPTEPKHKAEIPAAVGALSKKQKTNLILLSKKAFEKHERSGLVDDETGFDDWRAAEILTATGNRISGLRQAKQRDFRQIRGHFAKLNGDLGTAFQDATRDDPNLADWETNWKLLQRNCEKKGFHFPTYPAAICKAQFKCPLRDATTKQLFALVCTIRNRKEKPQA